MVSKFTSLNSENHSAVYPTVVSGLHFFQKTISALMVLALLCLAWTNANAQCTVMVTDPNVDLTVVGSTATLDDAAVAANISIGGTGVCTDHTFFDEFDNLLGSSVVVNCDGTSPGPGIYFLVIAEGTPDESNKVQLTVNLIDNTDPTFTVPADVTINCEDDRTDVSITGDVTDEMDNCAMGIEATFKDDVSGLTGCNGTGMVTRTWTLDDGNGNSVDQTQMITVQDVTPPTFMPPANVTISCDDDINDLTITGMATGGDDNCSTGLIPTYLDAALVPDIACVHGGTVDRTWTLVDDCLNATNFVQTITIVDNTKPTSTQADITVDNDAGVCNALVALTLTAANTSDVCDDFADLVSITNNRTAGGADASDTYPVGTTTVTFTIEDRCGNIGTHDVDVTVNDTLKPVIINCPMDVTLNADISDCDNTFSWTAPSAVSFCAGTPIADVIFSDDPNVLINTGTPGPGRVDFADFPVGTTTIGYAFTDANGNQDTCQFNVVVLDTQEPSITCPPDQTISFGSCTPPANLLVPNFSGLSNVSDNCANGFEILQDPPANSLLSAVTTLSDGDMFMVRMIARDLNANNGADTCFFNVTLNDTNTPIPNVAGAVLPNETSTCGELTVCAPTAMDNCGNLIVGTIVPSIPAGVTVVGTCTAPCSPNAPVTGGMGDPINDNSVTTINIPVSLADDFVDNLEISLDISHTWVGDLSASLISPTGTVVNLFNQPGFPSLAFGCDQANLNVTFSDDAMNSSVDFENTCEGFPAANAIEGTFQALDPLSDFSGEVVDGTWQLVISDGAAGDIGFVNGFSIDFCTLSGATIPQYSYAPGTYNLTWEYDDGNGNLANQTQTITVADDTEAPVINCADITVELDANGMANLNAGTFAGESINLTSGGNLSFVSGNSDICVTNTNLVSVNLSFAWDYDSPDISALWDPFGYTINGTFTALATSTLATDPASTQQSGVTSVTIPPGGEFCFRANTADNIPPSATTVVTNLSTGFTGIFDPANWTTTLDNSNGIASYQAADITDNCGVDLSTLAVNGLAMLDLDCSDLGTSMVTLTVDDINGNEGTCVANLTVVDLTAPTLSGVPADNTVSCSSAIVTPNVTASDVCDGALTAVLNEVSTKTGNPATCGDYTYTISRTWTATDNSGNSVTASQTLEVEDNDAPINPVFNDNLVGNTIGSDPFNCNADVTLALTDLTDCAPFANLTITNDSPFANAGGADASGNYPVGPHNVNFTVTDPCGNTISYNRTFTVIDDDGPVAACKALVTIGLPASGTLILNPAIIDNGSMDNCGTIVSMTVSPNTFDCDDADGVTPRQVTLTVIDDSGNSASCVAEVIIQDNDAPVASCQDITIELDQSGNASIDVSDINNGSSDNCTATADLLLSLSQTTFDVNDLGSTIPVTLTVEDSNGNTDNCTANVTVTVPQTCFNVGTAFGATGTIVSVPVTVENFTNVISFQFFSLISTLTTGEFVGISGNILPVTTFPNVVSGDTLSLNWTNTSGGSLEVSYPDGTTIFFLDILLTGTVGNTSVVSIIDDPMALPLELVYNYGAGPAAMVPCTNPGAVAINAPAALTVAGDILSPTGAGTANVDVTLENASNPAIVYGSMTTVAPGDFSFNPINAGLNVRIVPEKLTGWTNGVTANDLFEIQRHIVGLDTLDSNYKKVAADVRVDGLITGFDVVDLQILLGSLGTVTPPTNTSWKFAAVKDTLADLAPLFVPSITTELVINNLPMDSLNNDFVAIKIGDVTGNANPTSLTNGSNHAFSRSGEAVRMVMEDRSIRAGEDYEIALTAKDFNELVAYQWVLNFNPEVLSFTGYDKGALNSLSDANFGQYHLEEGLLPLIWHQATAAQYQEDEVLFTLNFKALKDAESLRDLLRVDETAMTAGAWKAEGLPQAIELEFTNAVNTGFSLLQNQPNPFKDQTVVGFYLPEATTATLQILDVSGRLIKAIEGAYAAGYNEVNISRSELPAAGVLYYRLETADEVATKKMIVVE